MNSVPEIRREKVFIPPGITTQEIKQEYALDSTREAEVRRKESFIRNSFRKDPWRPGDEEP